MKLWAGLTPNSRSAPFFFLVFLYLYSLGERPHICTHCGKSFAHKHCLNTHLLLHSTDRPYQCQECKKSFTLKHHLLTHSRVHSRERPFVCQECGRAFPLKRHLVTHSKFHAGERPYVCEECGESFAQENHLIMHSRWATTQSHLLLKLNSRFHCFAVFMVHWIHLFALIAEPRFHESFNWLITVAYTARYHTPAQFVAKNFYRSAH